MTLCALTFLLLFLLNQLIDASPQSVTYDFSEQPPGSILRGEASIVDGVLNLTALTASNWGVYIFDPYLSSAPVRWTIGFKHRQHSGSGADGMSFHFGPSPGDWTTYKDYDDFTIPDGLSLRFDQFTSLTGVYWLGIEIEKVAYADFETQAFITINYDENGLDYSGPGISFTDALLTDYSTKADSNWVLTFAARTGGLTNIHEVDDLQVEISTATVVDSVSPVVVSVTSPVSGGIFKLGDSIPLTVTFSEAVIVTGNPHLVLETGGTDAVVDFTGGSGSNVLTFSYTVDSGHSSDDLDYTATSALGLNGGAIRDSSGNVAILTLPAPGDVNSLGANKAILIDAVVPTVLSVTSSAADGIYSLGDSIPIRVIFSETIIVTGTPQLTLETGDVDVKINYMGGSGGDTLLFGYAIEVHHVSGDLDYVDTSALVLNEGMIQDSSANPATLILPVPGSPNSLGANKAIIVDNSTYTHYDLSQGWHLLSIPGIAEEDDLDAVFPQAEAAFTFDTEAAEYVQVEQVWPGGGFWLNLPVGLQKMVKTTPLESKAFDLSLGWNLVGSLDYAVPVDVLTGHLPQIVDVYGFSPESGYYVVFTTLVPGQGYWLNVAGEPVVSFDLSQIETSHVAKSRGQGHLEAGLFTVIEALGDSSRVWLELVTESSLHSDLPPPPPAGVIDVRIVLADHDTRQIAMGQLPISYHLRLQGAKQLRWHLPEWADGIWVLELPAHGRIALAGEGELALRMEAVSGFLHQTVGATTAGRFSLEGSYPNPFNPQTDIVYRLGTTASVRLEIYNSLGQLVRLLVDGERKMGVHRSAWDGRNDAGRSLTSGVYLVRLQVEVFQETHRMVLLR